MILLTEQASLKVLHSIQRRGRGKGIQIGVKTTGCSGMAYVLEYIDEPGSQEDWAVFESQGVKIYVSPKNLPYLDGLTVDYVKQGLQEGFSFINPNERDRCGCGESFRV